MVQVVTIGIQGPVGPKGNTGNGVDWGNVGGTLTNQLDLQTTLDNKVDNTQVLTDVPANALFTDTTYLIATTTSDGLLSLTDKTKLDGVENGATADQTATEILAAVKTVDGVGSGLDADLLDGFQADTLNTADTVSVRNATGDITCRSVRSEFATSSTTPLPTADIVFRNSEGFDTDNYIRFATRDQILSYLGISSGGGALGFGFAQNTSWSLANSSIPINSSAPSSTEGAEILSLNYTPKKSGSKIIVEACALMANNHTSDQGALIAIFVGANTSASAVGGDMFSGSQGLASPKVAYEYTTTSTNSITFKVRVGGSTGGTTINGIGATDFGSAGRSYIKLTEYE